MAENRTLFIASGITSLSLFSAILFLFIYMMFSSKDPSIFALQKDNFISVSIEIPVVKVKEVKAVKAKQQVVDPVEVTSEEAEIDIDNLFSDVWTKKIKKIVPKKKKTNTRRIQEIEKKIAVKETNQRNDITDKINNLENLDLNEDKDNSASTATEVNEYLAKIQALVYKYFYPPQNSQGHSVKAVIQLSSIGKVLDFRVLNYSANSSLNNECDKVKSRLMSVIFPINPQNKSGNYTILLKSEE